MVARSGVCAGWRAILVLAVVTACNPSKHGDPGPTGSTGTDTSGVVTPPPATSDTGSDRFGVCGLLGQATASPTEYQGTEEHYLIGDAGNGDDVCRVRVDVAFVGPPPMPCELCEFAVTVAFSNPVVITDVDEACANSDLGLDAAAIAALVTGTASYGHVEEYAGHNDVLMVFDETTSSWQARNFASYDAETKAFRYDRRDGFCSY